MIQICAKIGGVPWIIDEMPLLDRPSMVCGASFYKSPELGRKSILGFCSSFNSSATKYWSKSIIQESGIETQLLQTLMEKAIKKFQKMTKLYPERIFFYRDGLCDNQKDLEA
jgi:aubergine